jgi:hypothetical protein
MKRLDMFLFLAAAGAFGAFVATPFHGEITTTRQRVISIISGAAFSFFLAPMASMFFHIEQAYQPGVGFLLGMFGMSLAAGLSQAIRSFDWAGWFKGKLGGGQ